MPNRVDTVISKGRGIIKGVQARYRGLVGVFRILAEQHAQITTLLERVKTDENKRAALWPKIRIELLSHERAELSEVYPVLREHGETKALAIQHEADAKELEDVVDQLEVADLDSEEWGMLLEELAENVADHAIKEEQEIFPLAQRVIGEERAKELEQLFVAAKRQVADAV